MAVARLSAKLLAVKGQAQPSSSELRVARLAKRAKQGSPYFAPLTQMAEGENKVKKTLKLEGNLSRRLCLLSARTGVSQQRLMEQAVYAFLEQVQEDETCICLVR